MANTAFPRSIHRVDVFQTLEAYRPVVSQDWAMVAAWYLLPPSTSVTWSLAVTFDCNVDLDTIGEVRFVCSTGEVSNTARIWTYVERVSLGWMQINGAEERYVWLQARQGAGTASTGGGVHVVDAAALLMSAPPVTMTGYPPGYDPNGAPAPPNSYPPSYATPNPYG